MVAVMNVRSGVGRSSAVAALPRPNYTVNSARANPVRNSPKADVNLNKPSVALTHVDLDQRIVWARMFERQPLMNWNSGTLIARMRAA
jgi:hypothetical protein